MGKLRAATGYVMAACAGAVGGALWMRHHVWVPAAGMGVVRGMLLDPDPMDHSWRNDQTARVDVVFEGAKTRTARLCPGESYAFMLPAGEYKILVSSPAGDADPAVIEIEDGSIHQVDLSWPVS